ncbi:sensor histidine kinase [Hwanghaeella grinnelliae]|uniref:histidine kinase n=1 Tax=Hwanghaeella grinnelliae TaxID=2500179 RepID=A0A3S2Z730_9PROT|nr:cache domain-containing protein [Hwanghaeella grinnelliae]RVU36140.1 sensor histidine kinase [Hwanghaeella grinnelliae]
MSETAIGQRVWGIGRLWGKVAAVAVIGLMVLVFFTARSYFESLELQRAQSRVTLYRSTLLSALERYQHLPFVLAHDPFVLRAAQGFGRQQLNARLASFASEADLDAIYLMDRTGLTVAASNYDRDLTFLNQNYGFRPYFRAALAGERGQFFGIGATTSRPGYFIAEPVRNTDGAIVGVVALKLDLSGLERAWSDGGETVFVSNRDGIVLLSSEPSIRYRALDALSADQRRAIQARKQFGQEALAPLDWKRLGPDQVRLNGVSHLHVTAPIQGSDWVLHFLSPERDVLTRAWLVVIGAAILAIVISAAGLYLRIRRVRESLAESQAARRKLQAANIDLAREIEERREAERRLEKAQTELARTSKLAALGQLAASVTHELGQPISAMKNYLAAAELDAVPGEHSETFSRLSSVVGRMERLTQQLRFFARPSGAGVDGGANGAVGLKPVDMKPVDLKDVWHEAFALIEPDLDGAGIKLDAQLSDAPVMVQGDRLRLEQVVVNLCRNAVLAMQSAPRRKLTVRVEDADDLAQLSIRDTGPGLGGLTIEALQEPFVTTRASGEGMGLGLAISAEIVKEHDGRLTARDIPEQDGGGAEFTVTLPLKTEGPSRP